MDWREVTAGQGGQEVSGRRQRSRVARSNANWKKDALFLAVKNMTAPDQVGMKRRELNIYHSEGGDLKPRSRDGVEDFASQTCAKEKKLLFIVN